jgi:hypothetical protein
MDSLHKIRLIPKSASRVAIIPETETNQSIAPQTLFKKLSIKRRFEIAITLVSLLTFIVPHVTFGADKSGPKTGPLVFVVGNKIAYIDLLNLQLSRLYERQNMQADLTRQIELGDRVKAYLQDQNSPLSQFATTLIQLDNWKKIVALSNAESGMCRHYPVNKSNCWGVGGSNLWYMGSNLKEGILSMNSFLNSYPNNSTVKYSQMSFKQMNGLYKQPPAQHWVNNNQAIYDDLTAIEKSL